MKKTRIICLLTIACLSLAERQAMAFLFPRSTFSDTREFVILADAPAHAIAGFVSPVYVFDSVQKDCGLDDEEIRIRLSLLLNPSGLVETPLRKLFKEPFAKIQKSGVPVVIDSFGDKRSIFSSFYLSDVPKAGKQAIYLDCAAPSRAYWGASLAHEFTHILLHGDVTDPAGWPDSWIEEMLAQLMEAEAGGLQPIKRLELFQAETKPPALTEKHRPFLHGSNYAMSYLFGLYLRDRWSPSQQGWRTLRVFSGLDGVSRDCKVPGRDGLALGACRLSDDLRKNRSDPALIEKSTRSGLLRYFFTALIVHSDVYPFFSIPDWNGFSSAPLESIPALMTQDSFVRLTLPSGPIQLPAGTEGYGVKFSADKKSILRIQPVTSGELLDGVDSVFVVNIGK